MKGGQNRHDTRKICPGLYVSCVYWIDIWEELMLSAVACAGIIIVGLSLGHERKAV